MSKRTKRLQLLVDLAEEEQQKALNTLGAIQSQQNEHQSQLSSLQAYLQEYVDSINHKGMTVMPIQLQTTQGFIDKLNSAIVAQKNKLIELEQVVEMAQKDWFEKRARVKAMEKLFTKISSNESLALARQEQKMLDDLASQQFIKGIE